MMITIIIFVIGFYIYARYDNAKYKAEANTAQAQTIARNSLYRYLTHLFHSNIEQFQKEASTMPMTPEWIDEDTVGLISSLERDFKMCIDTLSLQSGVSPSDVERMIKRCSLEAMRKYTFVGRYSSHKQ